MGAWIEISNCVYRGKGVPSHPTWVRGLKSVDKLTIWETDGRTPHGCVD